MKAQFRFVRHIPFFVFLMMVFPVAAIGQLISIKSVPVATGEQFLLFPSQNLGMAGTSIALDDPFLDPFVNPAKGTRINGSFLLSSPTFYGISDDMGAGRTLPFGVMFGSEKQFGGLYLAAQQMESSKQEGFWNFGRFPQRLSDRFSNNMYVFGMFGTNLEGSKTAIGGSAFWADLDAVDGVDLLYAGSQDIEQFGDIIDYRIGLVSELEGERFFEALLLYNRFNMTHDVTYMDQQFRDDINRTIIQPRTERNLDRSRTWGLHLGYVQPIPDSEWRIGGILTGNWKSHPKIPNYEIMNIPRDPGNSWAYNIGLGLSSSQEKSIVGIDLIHEPIWSNTWADAADYVTTRSGHLLPPGSKTVDNDFRFSNWIARFGFTAHENENLRFQLGLQMRSIGYELHQDNYVEEFSRKQHERWQEWTVSWGLIFNLRELQVRYQGRVTTGTGRPGVDRSLVRGISGNFDASNFIVAPEGSLTLQDAHVITHRITVSIPIAG